MPIYTFGPFRLDTEAAILFHHSEPVSLGRRAVGLLRVLVERFAAPIAKETLIEMAWAGRAVEDSNLTVQIAALRRVLSRAPGGDRWIETLPRRGYRFVGPAVGEEENGDMAPPRVVAPRYGMPIQHGEAQRRQITALSCELIDVAPGADRVGLEDLNEAVGAFRRCISEAVGRHNGLIVRYLGNDVLVLFGYPSADEHDAERAVRAGLELCAAASTLRRGADVPMRCRVGIATGMVIAGGLEGVGELGDHDIVGDVPNRAVRLKLSAQPDAVMIESITRHLIGNLFDCRELGAIDTNSVADPVHGWQVLRESTVASRFEALRGPVLSPLVGRDEEIDLLVRRWRHPSTG